MVGDPPFELPDVVTLAVPAFIGLIVVEMLAARLSGRGGYDAADTGASLAMGLGNSVAKLAFGGLAVSAYWVVFNWRLYDIPWAWWSVLACFLGEDLAYYWFHRISHERRWFWASHVIHHTSQHYNLSTALRQTWTGVLGLTFVFWLPLVFIGFPPSMVFFFSSVSLVYQFWIHTETIGRLGPLEWIFNTPSHHRVHHAINPQYLDANYAGVLIIWDRLFATFVPEDAREKTQYGVIANLGTFNPLRVAFHEWIAMARDVMRAPSLGAAFMFVFGPPGWSPDGSRKTTRAIKAQWSPSAGAGRVAPGP